MNLHKILVKNTLMEFIKKSINFLISTIPQFHNSTFIFKSTDKVIKIK